MAFPDIRERIDINCLQWYEFQSNDKDKNFIGSKNGLDAPTGLLGNTKTVNDSQCRFNNSGYKDIKDIDKNVSTPFFRVTNSSSPNQDVADRITFINEN